MTNETTSPAEHPFERAGLGKAPFRFMGMVNTAAGVDASGMVRIGTTKDGLDILTTPGGTCAFCGQAIIVKCNIESSDGKRFHVGQDCVRKTSDRKIVDAVKRAASKQRKARARSNDVDLRAALKSHIEANREALSAQPHPSVYRAERGETMLDAIEWNLANAGMAGIKRLAKKLGVSK